MADLNKQALEMWNSMKPMIDREIEQQTKGTVQRRKAKVTTAPSLVTQKIGVTEPFGDQYFIPFNTNLSTAKVGDVVWVEFMYGATNAFASMYASADSKDVTVGGVLDVVNRHCSATLSSAGWYRVFLYSSTNDDELAGGKSANIRITITREGIAGNSFRNEVHFIDFSLAYGSYIFSNETSVTQSFAIDKIRYGYDLTNHFGFIDIHCKRNDSNPITVSFNVATDLETQGEMASVEPYSVADAPSGETVVATYVFAVNTEIPRQTFSPTAGAAYADFGGCWYAREGKHCHVHVGISGLTANTGTSVYTLPSDMRPPTLVLALGISDYLSPARIIVWANGLVEVLTTTTSALIDIDYYVE